MTLIDLLSLAIALPCLVWCGVFLYSIVVVRQITILEATTPATPATWPRLSIIVAARDEGDTIEAALRSLSAQDYPNLEIVVADDRSADATGKIVARLAAEDPRIIPVRIDSLPAGWLGKVHALHCAQQRATGDWLLLTDADVHFAPGILQRAVALALERRLDHLAVAPGQIAESFATRVAMAAFATFFLLGTRAHRVGRPGSDAFIGIGAFNLVRREAFERTPGLPWLRMEVIDDAGIGLMMQRSGARCAFAVSPEGVRLTWYPTLRHLCRGLEKNAFGPVARYRPGRGLAAIAVLIAITLAPLAALLLPLVMPLQPALSLVGLATWLTIVVAAAVNAPRARLPILPSVFIPIGFVILSYVAVRSALHLWRNQGVVWRDTRYSLEELREGQRVRL